MFSRSSVLTFVVSALLLAPVDARMAIAERDGRALYARRFGQENPAVLNDLRNACGGGVCATLAGQAISTLLAGAGECDQQNLADDIIDAARKQTDAATTSKMIDIAKTFRQAEKNTPPDFTVQPPALRNSVFCQTAPRNAELNGLNQAQDPANDPNLFFDPATKKTVKKGEQANTFPLKVNGAPAAVNNAASKNSTSVDNSNSNSNSTVVDNSKNSSNSTSNINSHGNNSTSSSSSNNNNNKNNNKNNHNNNKNNNNNSDLIINADGKCTFVATSTKIVEHTVTATIVVTSTAADASQTNSSNNNNNNNNNNKNKNNNSSSSSTSTSSSSSVKETASASSSSSNSKETSKASSSSSASSAQKTDGASALAAYNAKYRLRRAAAAKRSGRDRY